MSSYSDVAGAPTGWRRALSLNGSSEPVAGEKGPGCPTSVRKRAPELGAGSGGELFFGQSNLSFMKEPFRCHERCEFCDGGP
jgi:hypothetical protein